MQINPCSNIPKEQLTPTAWRKLLCYDKDYMFVYMECKAGTAQPPHSHMHVQVDYLIEGEIEFFCGGEVQIMKAGDIIQVPANVPHAFQKTIKDTKWIEFFTPAREDILPGGAESGR